MIESSTLSFLSPFGFRHSFVIGHSSFVIFGAPHDRRRKRLRPKQRKSLSGDLSLTARNSRVALNCNLRGFLNRITVSAATDRRKRQCFDFIFHRKLQ